MKTVAAILVAMVVSATATYFVTGTKNKVQVEQKVEAKTEDKDKTIAALRKALGEANAKANKNEVLVVEGAKVSLQGVVTVQSCDVLSLYPKSLKPHLPPEHP